mmetsp:Transcript_17627/g.44374  ORF Transcript_17627/g.44374 Transcript_17627/m.44374 type:complete len:217 (-) Transcript_17627:2-652(-)
MFAGARPTSAADVGDAVLVPPPMRAVLGGELLELVLDSHGAALGLGALPSLIEALLEVVLVHEALHGVLAARVQGVGVQLLLLPHTPRMAGPELVEGVVGGDVDREDAHGDGRNDERRERHEDRGPAPGVAVLGFSILREHREHRQHGRGGDGRVEVHHLRRRRGLRARHECAAQECERGAGADGGQEEAAGSAGHGCCPWGVPAGAGIGAPKGFA